MKIGFFVIVICALVAAACAADAPDAYTTKQPQLSSAASTTTAAPITATANEREVVSPDDEVPEAVEAPSAASSATDPDDLSTDEVVSPYRGIGIVMRLMSDILILTNSCIKNTTALLRRSCCTGIRS